MMGLALAIRQHLCGIMCPQITVRVGTSLGLEPAATAPVRFCVSYEQLAKCVMILGTSIRHIGSHFGNP